MPCLDRSTSLVLLSLALACGGGTGQTSTADDTTTADTSAATTDEPQTTTGAETSSTTGDEPTTTAAASTSTGDEPTSTTTTASDATTDATTDGTTATTDDTDTTTGGVSEFERFHMAMAAGPCPMENDCDGFIELLADGTLRVEKFGDVSNSVTEVAISADDLADAVETFADPALLAVLDGPDPLCNPPSDIFESMLVVVAGESHDADTTTCDQAPLTAARDLALALRTQYVP